MRAPGAASPQARAHLSYGGRGRRRRVIPRRRRWRRRRSRSRHGLRRLVGGNLHLSTHGKRARSNHARVETPTTSFRQKAQAERFADTGLPVLASAGRMARTLGASVTTGVVVAITGSSIRSLDTLLFFLKRPMAANGSRCSKGACARL